MNCLRRWVFWEKTATSRWEGFLRTHWPITSSCPIVIQGLLASKRCRISRGALDSSRSNPDLWETYNDAIASWLRGNGPGFWSSSCRWCVPVPVRVGPDGCTRGGKAWVHGRRRSVGARRRVQRRRRYRSGHVTVLRRVIFGWWGVVATAPEAASRSTSKLFKEWHTDDDDGNLELPVLRNHQ